jgi:hypothetical protein
MQRNFTIFFLFSYILIVLISCNKYGDLKIITEDNSISITEPKLNIALMSSEPIEGYLQINYKENILASERISSSLEEKFVTYLLDLGELDSDKIFSTLQTKQPLELTIIFVNEEEGSKIEKTENIYFKNQPISEVKLVKGPIIYHSFLSREDILKDVSRNKGNIIERPEVPNDLSVMEISTPSTLKITVDTVYYRSVIGKYPIVSNRTHHSSMDGVIKQYIDSGIENINIDSILQLPDGNYIIQDNLETTYSGDIGVYLLNITEDEDYFVQQIGIFRINNSEPEFSRVRVFPTDFKKNPFTEGIVWLDTREFYGHSPFTIPFVGLALGDISEIYVNNSRIHFEIGKDIFFKKRIHLDNGYNRIPVKIVDSQSNVTESYITVIIETMSQSN